MREVSLAGATKRSFLASRRWLLRTAVCACLVQVLGLASQAQIRNRVLVYTRNYTANGKGYVHENIPNSVAAIQKIGRARGFDVDVSDDPAIFTDKNLAQYATLIFSNSNDEAFATAAQRSAFQSYIHAGHGFVGLHSASGSERDWPYFQQVLGGHFAFHPQEQTFTVKVSQPDFLAVRGLPTQFLWTDECYFLDRLVPDIHPVLVTDRTRLLLLKAHLADATGFPNPLPLAWYHTFDNSREFYLALGHNPADYDNQQLLGIIERAILWTMRAQD